VQSFGGFVPGAVARLYPGITLHPTLWNAGFPEEQRPVLLSPDEELFATITRMFMEEWQKEFGKADHYLVDSFNELQLPESDKPRTEILAEYGEKTYQAIKSGNPDAVWAIQGWMFSYQRDIWNPETVQALFSRVPDNEVIILDYANDYNRNWDVMNSFNGKQWIYGFVPNMGGKTAYTGDLQLYASGAARVLHSPDKKNLVGFTISGEGLENNTVIYELLTDVAWSEDSIDLDNWLKAYSVNRYGGCPDAMSKSWNLLRASAYKSLVPHPQFGWQLGRLGQGTVNKDPEFNESTRLFLSCAEDLGDSECFRADALERAALTLGLIADEYFGLAGKAFNAGKPGLGEMAGERGLELLTGIDRLLISHPLLRLDYWLDFARSHSSDPALEQFYAANARQIITTWGPPVNDYACRVWSGLIRDFYVERMRQVLAAASSGNSFNSIPWEVEWVESNQPLSRAEPFADPLKAAISLVSSAMNEDLPLLSDLEDKTGTQNFQFR
jgi:alpha-N-acetylglucosaminidase